MSGILRRVQSLAQIQKDKFYRYLSTGVNEDEDEDEKDDKKSTKLARKTALKGETKPQRYDKGSNLTDRVMYEMAAWEKESAHQYILECIHVYVYVLHSICL